MYTVIYIHILCIHPTANWIPSEQRQKPPSKDFIQSVN